LLLAIDIEDVGQELIEDNIVAVSKQMINKESSVARVPNTQDTENGGDMDVDEKL
jgi:26S proteasome regulatory subunit N11